MEHHELTALADRAFSEAKRRGGTWIACRAGCDSCCRKPFAISSADRKRLRSALGELDPAVAATIVERARDARARLSGDFPGDRDTGVLTENSEWREWFFARHSGVPCPALDLDSGACLVYEYRPIACRLYGPLIQIGGQVSDPCPLCFSGASPDEIEATRVTVDLPEAPARSSGDTIVAFALTDPLR